MMPFAVLTLGSTLLSLNPDIADSYHNRGIAYLNLNQEEQAKQDWLKACDMGFIDSCSALTDFGFMSDASDADGIE